MSQPSNQNKNTQPESAPLVAALRRLVASNPEKWATHFEKLVKDIMDMNSSDNLDFVSSEQDMPLDCAACQNNLDLYLTAESNGDDVKFLYPTVWRHLQTCRDCVQVYLHLKELLIVGPNELPAGNMPVLLPEQLPFLSPPTAQSPWITRLRSQLTGAPFNLSVQFNLEYLKTLFTLPAFAPTREVVAIPSDVQLLLHQPVVIGEQTLTIELTYSQPVNQPDKINLQATVVCDGPLPANLMAQLTWADQTCHASVTPEGTVNFGYVSLTALKESVETGAGNFVITIQENGGGVEQ